MKEYVETNDSQTSVNDAQSKRVSMMLYEEMTVT